MHRKILRALSLSLALYDKTKIEPWSETIAKRRLRFFGHIARLDENAPAAVDGFAFEDERCEIDNKCSKILFKELRYNLF